MFLDTSFLISLIEEIEGRIVGTARIFLGRHRAQVPNVSVISLGEIAAGMRDNHTARDFLSRFRIVTLKPEVALEAASIDRELIRVGGRLGENDTWIAGYARYYGERLVSNNKAFDRVAGLRRIGH
jgi:predicted nucleic acid-binding protein